MGVAHPQQLWHCTQDAGLSEGWSASTVSTESTAVFCFHGCCLHWGKKWSAFWVAVCLVLMAPIMEQLGRCVAEWRAILLDKRLKDNAGKSKVMVGSSGGKMIVNSGKWPCGVCGKGVHANSVQCTLCKKWIRKRSGVHGDLSLKVSGVSEVTGLSKKLI